MTFASLVMPTLAMAMFACSVSTNILPFHGNLMEECFALMEKLSEEVRNVPSPRVPRFHPWDPLPPWGTQDLLTRNCELFVKDISLKVATPTTILSIFSRVVRWQPLLEGIKLVEFFGGIGTGLAAALEIGFCVRRYIHVDNGFISCKAAWHQPVFGSVSGPKIFIRYYFMFFVASSRCITH